MVMVIVGKQRRVGDGNHVLQCPEALLVAHGVPSVAHPSPIRRREWLRGAGGVERRGAAPGRALETVVQQRINQQGGGVRWSWRG